MGSHPPPPRIPPRTNHNLLAKKIKKQGYSWIALMPSAYKPQQEVGGRWKAGLAHQFSNWLPSEVETGENRSKNTSWCVSWKGHQPCLACPHMHTANQLPSVDSLLSFTRSTKKCGKEQTKAVEVQQDLSTISRGL